MNAITECQSPDQWIINRLVWTCVSEWGSLMRVQYIDCITLGLLALCVWPPSVVNYRIIIIPVLSL